MISNKRSLLALDLFSLFLAPVRGGAGPYLAFYFASERHWGAGAIGLLLGTMALCFAMSQIPAGMITDKLNCRRELAAAALAMIALAMLSMLLMPALPVTLLAQAIIGFSCAFFAPTVASLSLSLTGYDMLNPRLGRNEVFCNLGNVLTGLVLGMGMHFLGGRLILSVLIFFCLAAAAAVFCIRPKDFVEDSLNKVKKEAPALLNGFKALLTTRGAKPFALCAGMFFFANAAMLPLMIQVISRQGQDASVRLPAALLIAEFVMIPVCAIAGKKATWGRKPLLLASFLLLAARGLCFGLLRDPNLLVAAQVLDGISAGIFSLLLTIVVADLSRAKGNLNSMLCTLMMILTTINAMSDFVCGSLAAAFGFTTTFGLMAAIAFGGGLILMLFVPETAPEAEDRALVATPA